MSEAQNIDDYDPNKNDSGPLREDLKDYEKRYTQSEDSIQIKEDIPNNLDKDKQKEKDTLKLSQSFPENIGLDKSEQYSSKKINNFNFYRFRIIRR